LLHLPATGITAYLLNGGTPDRALTIDAHESPPTPEIYGRTAVEDIETIGI